MTPGGRRLPGVHVNERFEALSCSPVAQHGAEVSSARTSPLSSSPRTTAWAVVPVLVAAVFTAVLYGLTMLLPYVVNDLDRVALDELTSGRYDPEDLWPQGPLAGLTQLGAFLAILLMLLVPWVGGVWVAVCVVGALLERRWALAGVAVATSVVCGALALVSLTPLHSALTTWRMD